MPSPRVIVVGGGLSGLSAAHTLYLSGGNVLVLDKQGFFGGNSTKATSGINGALTRTQVDAGIPDSVKQFYDDTLKSARDKARPDLIKVLTYKSAAAVEWLQDVFNLDLTLVSRLGGHSQPRTHRGHDAKFPGMAITYALMQRLEELAEKEPHRVQIIKKARVTGLNRADDDDDGKGGAGHRITGVTYEFGGQNYSVDGPVILATGGYAADFTDTSLLKKYKPEVYDLPSTNGAHATGDGQKMVMAIGGNGIDMDKVQVHPTGLVDPKDPGSKWKFLAAEALRGEGGILLNADGDRFCDELGHRDYVSNEMFKSKFPIRLVLNAKASRVLDFHTRHYTGRGLMKKMSGAQLAAEIGCGEAHLRRTFADYNAVAAGKRPDPFGKRFFHNTPFDLDDEFFHVALMQPVLHFTMGGVEINERAEVLRAADGRPFEGLFACGELAGGVHGANRLGGSSLLGCVVYGRVAGESASRYLFQRMLTDAPAAATGAGAGAGDGARAAAPGPSTAAAAAAAASSVAQQRLAQISLHIDPARPGHISIDWSSSSSAPSSSSSFVSSSSGDRQQPIAASRTTAAAAAQNEQGSTVQDRQSQQSAAPVLKAGTGADSTADPGKVAKPADPKQFRVPEREFSMDEVAKHNTKDDLWIVVKGVVLDVTHWLDEHPGGPQALMNFMGRDATEEFEMLHDDEVIPKYASQVVIGRVKGQTPSLKI